MRPLTLSLTVAALALGGVALAQPVGVVDPWQRPNGASASVSDSGSWFASGAEARPEPLPVEAVLKDPWAPVVERKAPPVVAPVGLVDVPMDLRPIERARSAPLPSSEPLVIDPWAPNIASELPSLANDPKPQAVLDRAASARWSARAEEIVDPWRRLPEWKAPERIPLVVDPWTR